MVYLPGHGFRSLHSPFSSPFPGHFLPPNCGRGLVQYFFLILVPLVPQSTLQVPQLSQLDQCPSTEMKLFNMPPNQHFCSLLGQSFSLQSSAMAVPPPMQSNPASMGSLVWTSRHSLVFLFLPRPQVKLHLLHSVHWVHIGSRKMELSCLKT